MASTADDLIAVMDIDGIPNHELIRDLFICLIVSPLERGERAIRKDDAPAVGYIRRVALDDADIVRGIGLFDEQAAIESCGPGAEDDNFHAVFLPTLVPQRQPLYAYPTLQGCRPVGRAGQGQTRLERALIHHILLLRSRA